MTQYLPPNLLALFAPREPIPYLPPPDKLPHEKKTAGYLGIGSFMQMFEDPKETPPPMRVETREERQERKRREKAEQVAYKLEQDIALWDPHNSPTSTTDPYKTLFIARINYDTTESKLRREFEVYGAIKKIVLVHDGTTEKPRGYAFIEYEHERDMHSAYKHGDGKKIDGKRVLVDVERGRIVKGWLPRRLGGGMGGTRRGGPEVNVKHSGREDSRLDGSYLERGDRERPERGSERSERSGGGGGGGGERDRDRSERREKRRSRSRDRDRKRRSRSRDRSHRDRSGRERSSGGLIIEKTEDGVPNGIPPGGESKKRDRRRSRSRERGGGEGGGSGRSRSERGDRKRRRTSRSKSRDRKRSDREDRRSDRGGGGDKERSSNSQDNQSEEVVIKTEPEDDGYNMAEYGYDGDSNSFSNSYNNNNNNASANENKNGGERGTSERGERERGGTGNYEYEDDN